MNIERMRSIIEYSEHNRDEIIEKVRLFCSLSGIAYDSEVMNIMQVIRSSFKDNGYFTFEMPFADDEICAFTYRGDGLGYVVLNTSSPGVNLNFAIAHEAYHVLFRSGGFVGRIEFSDEYFYEHEEEFAANLFAGMLLMPEQSFRRMYAKFYMDSDGDFVNTLVRLMSYYRVPFMSAFIRTYELDMCDNSDFSVDLLNIDTDFIKDRFAELWLDDSILYPSFKDDYPLIEKLVESVGEEYVAKQYLNTRKVDLVLRNMRSLYSELKRG